MTGTLVSKQLSHNRISATWKVDIYHDNKEVISPTFSMKIEEDPTMTLYISAYFNKHHQISLHIHNSLLTVGRAIIDIALKNRGKSCRVKTCVDENWLSITEFEKFVTLLNSQNMMSIIVECTVTWLGFAAPHNPRNIRNFSYSPKFSFNYTCMSDVIIFIGNRELPAHKVILAAHSPVLMAMFMTDMKEAKENRIIVEDIEFTTMEILLQIIYTNDTKDLNDHEVALKVLAATEKYQMLDVKSICEYKLQMNLNNENALMILKEADKYNAEELCHTAINYIIGKQGEIISLDEFMVMCLQKQSIASALIKTQLYKLF